MKLDLNQYNRDCECGQRHEVTVRHISIEPGAIEGLEDIAGELGLDPSQGISVYDTHTYEACPLHPAASKQIILNPNGLHANEHGIEMVMEKVSNCQFLYAIGGGTIHDLTRYAAHKLGVPFLSVPTACSADAYASRSCSLTLGGFKHSVFARMPEAICADTNILKKAPLHLALSGFGDMMGKYTGILDWRVSHILTGESYCPQIAKMQLKAVSMALDSCERLEARDPEAYETLMYGLLLSGMAIQMHGSSRPASGAEHYISHFWEMGCLGHYEESLHGERVGVATLMILEKYREILENKEAFLASLRGERVDEDMLRGFFGHLYARISQENERDCTAHITRGQVEPHWEEIASLIRSLPRAEELKAVYQKIGAKAEMADVGLDDKDARRTLAFSPFVRNTLTLNRLACRKK